MNHNSDWSHLNMLLEFLTKFYVCIWMINTFKFPTTATIMTVLHRPLLVLVVFMHYGERERASRLWMEIYSVALPLV